MALRNFCRAPNFLDMEFLIRLEIYHLAGSGKQALLLDPTPGLICNGHAGFEGPKGPVGQNG